MRKYLFCLGTGLFISCLLFGQDPDTIRVDSVLLQAADSIIAEEDLGFFKKDYPDPKKAGLMSLVIPGAGQIYNKSWWKVPIIYGAMGGMIYVIQFNNEQYQRLDDAYQAKINDQPHEFSGTSIDNLRSLRSLRDQYDKNRQLSWFGLVFVYMLNGLEAFVDAHLKSFDIDDNLSIRVEPRLQMSTPLGGPQPVLGLGVSIPLQSKPPARPAMP